MTIIKLSLLALAVFVLASCGTTTKPKNQSEIGTAFGQVKTATYAEPVLPFGTPMHLQVGQHVRYGIVDKDGQKSISAYSVIGQAGDVWILESYTLTAGNESWAQLKVAGLDLAMVSRNPDDVHLISVRTRNNDDAPTEIDGVVLSLTKGIYKDALSHWTMKVTPEGKDIVMTVPAGTFHGLVKASTKMHIFGSELTSTGYYHPAVPISGLVKSTSSNGVEMSLLDFGMSGAKPSF